MSRIIAVSSGSGGAGKTHVSLNLALHCARAGLRTCIFDAGLGPASVNQLLKLTPQQTLADVLAGRCHLQDIIQTGFGIDIIPGGSAVEYTADLPAAVLSRLGEAVTTLARYDLIVIDTAAGRAAKALALVAAVPEVVLVITPEPTSLTAAYAQVKLLQRQGYAGRLQVVVNQARSERQALQTYVKFREIVRVYQGIDLPLLGAIPVDGRDREATGLQTPVSILQPDSGAGLAFAELAARLLQIPASVSGQAALNDVWLQLTGHALGPLPAAAASIHATQIDAAPRAPDACPPPHPAAQSRQPQRRAGEAPHGVRGLRGAQRATPIDALQLRRVVGRMLVKAMPGVDPAAATAMAPVQIAVDQVQLDGDNDFNLRPGRYTHIALHCAHIQSPDLFIEEIFANCAISGCKVRHLGSQVRYWVTSGRDGCILLNGDVGDPNCVQVYMAAGGNSPLEAVGSELEALPTLRRTAEGEPAARAPALLLGKFPHERLPCGEGDGAIILYRLLRRDRAPLLCAFHHADGADVSGALREHSPA